MSENNNDDDLKPAPGVAPDVWTHFEMHRKSSRTTVSTTELIDGVLFFAVLTYGEDGRLESKNLTRGDLVRG